MASKTFAYVWAYIVKHEYQNAFEKAYGPDGDWVLLFKKSNNYIATELHRDIHTPNRFITIDYWTSKEAFDNFRKEFNKEFNSLDNRFEALTLTENHIGDFESDIKKG